jgi:hypothetical protein
MPEVRDWRKKREAARVKRESGVASGTQEVEEVEEIEWQDADIDVSLLLRLPTRRVSIYLNEH